MNIFVLDLDVKKCAEYHSNPHVLKMIIEYNQLLCSAHWLTGGEAPYKLTHKNHPCAIWTRECLENYIWLADLCLELCYKPIVHNIVIYLNLIETFPFLL